MCEHDEKVCLFHRDKKLYQQTYADGSVYLVCPDPKCNYSVQIKKGQDHK